MTTNKGRDIQVLTYILKNQMKIRSAVERLGASLNSSASNSILQDEQAFDLCAMYMAQIGENVKLLTDESKDSLSETISLDVLKYFRNMIDHDYEKINKSFLLPYIESTQSDKAISAVKQLITQYTNDMNSNKGDTK